MLRDQITRSVNGIQLPLTYGELVGLWSDELTVHNPLGSSPL